MHNITLIGMPGSGKTTFGKTLAAGLSYHFIDTDDVIIQTYHKPLMELIDEYGTEGFITLEGKVLQSDRKSTRLNSRHIEESRMPSSA